MARARSRVTRIGALFMSSLVTASPMAGACPAYLAAQSVELPVGKRAEVRVFARTGEGAAATWTSLAVQVDALDDKGVLKAGELDDQLISPLDRLALRVEDFGPRAEDTVPSPCKNARVVELKTPAPERFAYLTVCENDGGKTLTKAVLPVTHDAAAFHIDAPRFSYDYQPNNQLMYRSLTAKSVRWPKPVIAATDADLNLHLDIKKFFTLDFTNKDVESYVGNTHQGPVGLVGSMDFFLRLLMFKINLKMGTTVGFYGDSAHIPAMIDVPRDAPKMLHPGSGLLYTWKNGATQVDQSDPAKTMPFVAPSLITAGWEKNATAGLPYCQGDVCVYRLRGTIADEFFGLDINVPKPMVQRGFYPQWVPDVATFKKNVGWDDDADEPAGTVAVYFDNGGLLKGQYKIDQWIRIGQVADFATQCPRPIDVVGVRKFDQPADVAH